MKYAVFSTIALLIPGLAGAATLTLHADPSVVAAGSTVLVTVSVDSDTPVNAFSGTLHFPNSLIPVSTSDGDSIISAWITPPKVATTGISFAGIVPGGFAGRGGKLFSAVLRATAAGSVTVALSDVRVLRNDGAGTAEPTTATPLTLTVSKSTGSAYAAPADTAPPESFTPHIVPAGVLPGAQASVVFSTVDKGSGIGHYEVAETRLPGFLAPLRWERATSPFTLHDQYLTSDVYVKAVDRAGNARVAFVMRPHLLRPQEALAGGILLVAVFAFIFWRRRRSEP